MGCSKTRAEEREENEAAEREENRALAANERLKHLQAGGHDVVMTVSIKGIKTVGTIGVTLKDAKEGIADVAVQFEDGCVHWVPVNSLADLVLTDDEKVEVLALANEIADNQLKEAAHEFMRQAMQKFRRIDSDGKFSDSLSLINEMKTDEGERFNLVVEARIEYPDEEKKEESCAGK